MYECARDTLLRIFSHRRDYDWHSAFDEFTERKIKRWKTAYDARKTDKPPPKNMFETLTMKVRYMFWFVFFIFYMIF